MIYPFVINSQYIIILFEEVRFWFLQYCHNSRIYTLTLNVKSLYCMINAICEIIYLNYLLMKYSVTFIWASLVAQRLKRLPAMWETWVQSLGREDPLE